MLSKTFVTVTFNITCFSISYQSIRTLLGINTYYIGIIWYLQRYSLYSLCILELWLSPHFIHWCNDRSPRHQPPDYAAVAPPSLQFAAPPLCAASVFVEAVSRLHRVSDQSRRRTKTTIWPCQALYLAFLLLLTAHSGRFGKILSNKKSVFSMKSDSYP